MGVPEFLIYDEINLQLADLKIPDVINDIQKAFDDGADNIYIDRGKIVLCRWFTDDEKREYEIKKLEKRLKKLKEDK